MSLHREASWSDAWPPVHLRLATPRLELRPLTDSDLPLLLETAREGVHDPGVMPFPTGWTALPPGRFERSFVQYFWSHRATWSVDAWVLPLVALLDGRAIGVQQIQAERFPLLRVVETSSWVALPLQGRGLGTEMRAAALELSFEGLRAEVANSGALVDNLASRRISERLGYRANGIRYELANELAVQVQRFQLSRAEWRRRVTVTIEGLDRCRQMFQ